MDKKQALKLANDAIERQRELLKDPKISPKLCFEVTRDILDRFGYPKITTSKVQNTTKVLSGADPKQEREMVLAEFKEIKDELKQIEVDKNGGE